MIRRLRIVALLALCGTSPSLAQQTLVAQQGEEHERELAPGQSLSFRLELEAKSFLNLRVDQLGIDISLGWYSPSGELLAEVDRRRGGSSGEQLLWVNQQAGAHRLEVRGGEGGPSGRFRIRIRSLRPAAPEDEALVAALGAYHRGLDLRRKGTAAATREAIREYKQALPLWKRAGEERPEASTLHNLGVAHLAIDEAREALSYLEQALERWRCLKDKKSEADSLYSAADALIRLGRPALARSRLDSALAVSQEFEDPARRMRLLSLQGDIERFQGQIPEALESYQQALAADPKRSDAAASALALNGLGLLYLDLGEADRALDFFQQSLDYWEKSGNRSGLSSTLNNLGAGYRLRGDPQALDFYRRALEIHRETGRRRLQAAILINIGFLLGQGDAKQEALEHYLEALELSRQSGDRRLEANALNLIGGLKIERGQVREALEDLAASLEIRKSLFDPHGKAATLFNLARAEKELAHPERALELVEQAIQINESLRGLAPSPELRFSLSALIHRWYELQVQLLMELALRSSQPDRYLAAAFEASERGRARSLLELLAESKVDIDESRAPELSDREREVFRRLGRIQKQLSQVLSSPTPDEGAVEELRQQWAEADRERHQLEIQIRRNHPRFAGIRYPKPVSAIEFQRLLDDETVALHYSLGNESSYLVIVSNKGLRGYSLEPAAEIRTAASAFTESLRRPGRRGLATYLRSGHHLYRMLLAPAEKALERAKRIIVLPDGVLHQVAFEALLDEAPHRTARRSFAELPYLLKRWTFSYAPSATTLSMLGGPSRPPDSLVAFGDSRVSHPASLVTAERGNAAARLLTPLSHSASEVRQIAALFDPQRSRVYVGDESSEENVKRRSEVEQAAIVHFASHALIDQRRPEYSGLALSHDGDSPEDGLLQVYEIFRLKLGAELVVLSACETGGGKEMRGEGLVGLTQAFFYAGARNLVASLWSVADRSTSELMVSFYRNLLEDGDKARALNRAKLALATGERYSHPFYWAPFVLVGGS